MYNTFHFGKIGFLSLYNMLPLLQNCIKLIIYFGIAEQKGSFCASELLVHYTVLNDTMI